jgi:hypothetical protein
MKHTCETVQFLIYPPTPLLPSLLPSMLRTWGIHWWILAAGILAFSGFRVAQTCHNLSKYCPSTCICTHGAGSLGVDGDTEMNTTGHLLLRNWSSRNMIPLWRKEGEWPVFKLEFKFDTRFQKENKNLTSLMTVILIEDRQIQTGAGAIWNHRSPTSQSSAKQEPELRRMDSSSQFRLTLKESMRRWVASTLFLRV